MNPAVKKYLFPGICFVTVIMATMIGGFVMGGLFMGLMVSIAIWMSINKLQKKIKNWIGKHPIISDLVFLKLSAAMFALIGGGPTMFMALATQAIVLGMLLKTYEQDNLDGNFQPQPVV